LCVYQAAYKYPLVEITWIYHSCTVAKKPA
jgi:hypothetical protein